MDSSLVRLIGVFDDKGVDESFTYTVNLPAPWNLWIGERTADGTRMGVLFMGYVLNQLIEADAWNPGDSTIVTDQEGVKLLAAVLPTLVRNQDLDAYQAEGELVRPVV